MHIGIIGLGKTGANVADRRRHGAEVVVDGGNSNKRAPRTMRHDSTATR